MNRGTSYCARRGTRKPMRNAARFFLVLMCATFAVTAVLDGTSWVSVSAQDRVDRAISTSVDVRPTDLTALPAGADWLSYHGDYSGRRFSGLTEITPANVTQLKAQWVFHVRDVSDLEVTPVVVGGMMFVTAANDAYALDARTGRTIWHYSRPITEGLIDDASQHHNRGVGVWHHRVFLETDNA